MKILLTGGSGMLGRNLLAQAKSLGLDIVAPTRADLDLLNNDMVRVYMHALKPDMVIHAAGMVGGIQANMQAPYDFCYLNLQMGIHVLQSAFAAGVEKCINFGSSCMYPRFAPNPLKEVDILTGELEPTNEGYAIAKIAVAKMGQYMSQQYGVQYKTILPCNLYGLWDKFGVENSHMIPAVIRKIHEAKRQGRPQVDIWGDGSARREFMFAGDLADFVFAILPKFHELPLYTNVGVGHDYSINEYYHMVRQALGYQGDFRHDLSKPSGMQQKMVDVTVQTQLGWQPKTDISTGILRAYEYYLTEEL